MDHPVSAQVALVLRDMKGRVRQGVLVDTLLRGAVLTDLALDARLIDEDSEISIDETPSGYQVADDLARAMANEPERTLHDWLVLREPVQPGLIAYWLADGRWRQHRSRRRPRYEDGVEYQVAPLRWRLRHIANGDEQAEPATTCVAILASLAGLLDAEPNEIDEEVLTRCGRASWLMPTIQAWALERIALQRALAAGASAGSLASPPGS